MIEPRLAFLFLAAERRFLGMDTGWKCPGRWVPHTFLMAFPCHCKSMLISHNWLTWQMFKCLNIWNRDRTEMGFLSSALCSAPRLKSWGSLDETFAFSAAVKNHSVRTIRVCTLAGLPTLVELSCLPTALRYVWVYTAAHEKCYN